MSCTWQLRVACTTDLDSILAIESTVFAGDAWSQEAMALELANEHSYYLVASPSDNLARVDAYAGLLGPRGVGQADVQTLVVAPEARGNRLGWALMQRLLAEASCRDATEVFLEVRSDNSVAIALYESLGFTPITVRQRYYCDGVDAIVMRVGLREPHAVLSGFADSVHEGNVR